MFDELLKETGRASLLAASKYHTVILLGDEIHSIKLANWEVKMVTTSAYPR